VSNRAIRLADKFEEREVGGDEKSSKRCRMAVVISLGGIII
jgi:hypothetical protein